MSLTKRREAAPLASITWRKVPGVAGVLAFALLCLGSRPAYMQTRAETAGGLREQARGLLAQTSGRIELAGLREQVEIVRDTWGVPHIYAKTEEDLFFAQGYVVAQDRLWQLDLWRRKAEGRLAELLGPAAVERDRHARLLRYRGDMEEEWRSYSPDTRKIVEAFVRGINACIAQMGDRVPLEFHLLQTRPEPWTPEVVISRLAGYPMTGNAGREVLRAEMIHRLGLERAAQLFPTDPPHKIEVPAGLDLEGIEARILAGIEAASGGVDFAALAGSNNWVVAGARTTTGKPILANDPHRALMLPSLRYIVHLAGPGWNVIGAGEPALPGISIGHNERIAFGLTVFAADQQDIYVERTHPEDASLYFDPKHPGRWRKMEIITEEICVRGEAQPRRTELKYTHHGPVIYEDRARRRAYVLRWIGSAPGTAGYLAGLAISRAQNWSEFRRALERWKLPAENFVYADVEGNIGYQAAGLVPQRTTWDGLLPVPADSGKHEWRGFYRLDDLPHEFNPKRGYIATANHNTLPPGEQRAIGFDFSAPYRVARIREALEEVGAHSVADSQQLQGDVASLVARELLLLLKLIPPGGEKRGRALEMLRAWDMRLEKDSATAALLEVWLDKLRDALLHPLFPTELRGRGRSAVGLPTLVRALQTGSPAFFGQNQTVRRNEMLGSTLDEAVGELEKRLGPEMSQWRWGALHTAQFSHPLATTRERAAVMSRGPLERGGDGTTVNATGGAAFRQSSGASFRQVLDLNDWDQSVASNVPGQSGQPESLHYDDLLWLWGRDAHFPLVFSRAAVEKNSRSRLLLVPSAARTAR